MPLIALTGGIAAGKSTVAQRLAERGAVIVDADRIVREVQEPGTPVTAAIAAAFGDAVLHPDGALDRAALGSVVFHDPAALARLNAIVHPAVKAESQRRFDAAFRADPAAVVVYDVPLLVEARTADPWDRIVVAHAPAAVRAERLVALRGLSPAEAAGRIASQASDEERLAVADEIVDTTGTMADTLAQVDALWERLRG